MKSNKRRNENSRRKHYINKQIKASQVLCIDENNKNCGVISISDALSKANLQGLDLVQIADSNSAPTCRILDYSKFKYEQSKKEKLAKKKQRESSLKVKEIKLRPSTGEHDLKIKAKQASEFLSSGHKIKLTITFKGREISHRYLGDDTLNLFLDMLPDAELSDTPSMSGRSLSAIVTKKSGVQVMKDNIA